jgi:uncharacterized protein
MASTSQDLFTAIASGDDGAVRALLNEDPALAVARDPEGVSALMRARYRNDRLSMQAIAGCVPELDLFEAAAFDDLDRITELLAYDPAQVDAYSGDGFTALHLAAFYGRERAARLLLAHGADTDARGRGWMTGTPLHSAASGGHTEVARALLDAGADPDVRQAGGWSALGGAAHDGNAELVDLLLRAGADPAAVDDEGRSVLAIAEERGDQATLQRLRDALRDRS